MTRRHSTPTLIAVACASALAGAWLASRPVPVAPATVPAHALESAVATDPVGPDSVAARRPPKPRTLYAASGPTDAAVGDDSFESRQRRAKEDPAFLADLLRRYGAAVDLDERGALLAVIAGAPNAQVLAWARGRLDAGDPRARQDALDLLKTFPMDDAAARELVVDRLAHESDAGTLSALVDTLTPGAVAEEDAAPVIARLAELSQHADPAVRARSVLQRAQWTSANDAEAPLHEALSDPSPAVRRAAVAGVIGSQAQSVRLKQALFEMVTDPSNDEEDRGAALFALQRYSLNRAEHALYSQHQAAWDRRQAAAH